jgi:hypothetical protein
MGLNKYLLDLPMDPRLNDVGAITVKEYFQRLLLKYGLSKGTVRHIFSVKCLLLSQTIS